MFRFSDNFKAEQIKRERKDIDFTSKNLYRKSSSDNSAGKYLRKESNIVYSWEYFEKHCECCGIEFNLFNKTGFTLCKTCNEQLQKDLKPLDNSIRKKYGRKPLSSDKETTKLIKGNTNHYSTISSFIDSKRRKVINHILRSQSCNITIDDLYEMPFEEYEKLKNDIKAYNAQKEQVLTVDLL